MRVMVTGASGFIGRALVKRLLDEGRYEVRIATRRHSDEGDMQRVDVAHIPDVSASTHWRSALTGVDVVIHLAARVHLQRADAEARSDFRRINVDGACNLARQAAVAGTRRLIFLSTVKVHGEGGARAYREDDTLQPEDAYAVSKHEAELGLREIAAQTGIEIVVIRPPLVYGPGVKANFRTLIRVIEMGIPLPFGAVDNRRSIVALDNLTDFIATCITHPNAAGEAFLISDGEDLSTPELIRRLARAMGRPARLFSVPPALLAKAATIAGRGALAQRLLASLQVDPSKARERLNWAPALTVEEGLRATVAHYGGEKRA